MAQVGDYGITEKEATWTAYGFDQEFIGSRIDFMVWDDLGEPEKAEDPSCARAAAE